MTAPRDSRFSMRPTRDILIVDDDPVVTRMLCRVLSNHSVVVAHSGRDAIEYELAGALVVLGLVLWGITLLLNRRLGTKQATLDPSKLE